MNEQLLKEAKSLLGSILVNTPPDGKFDKSHITQIVIATSLIVIADSLQKIAYVAGGAEQETKDFPS